MIDISLVIPCYNEEDSLQELMAWIDSALSSSTLQYEVIFIDDGSTDTTWSIIKKLSHTYPCIQAIRFNRNYGKAATFQVAFKKAIGEVIVTLDADLQDSPDEIIPLYKMIKEEKYDIVSGWKRDRKDPLNKTLPSKLFNFVVGKISRIKLHDFNCGLKAYNKKVIKNIHLYGDMHRYIPLIAKWNGYDKIGEKVIQHFPRKYGISKYGISRMITGFLDLLSITFISKFKKHPMHLFGTMGVITFFFGFLAFGFIIFDKLYTNLILNVALTRSVTDKWFFYVALVCIIIGVQLFMTGFLGEMMANNQQGKRKRDEYDVYIIDDIILKQ